MRTLKIFLLALFFLPLSALATPDASDASDPNSLMVEALEAPLRSIDAAIKSIENGDSPMLAAQQLGQQALMAWQALQTFQAIQGNTWQAKVMKPIYFVTGAFLLFVGYTLGVLMPFVPLIAFIGGALFWFVYVVTGTTMASFFALACIGGDALRRRAYIEQIISCMADVILRPSLMVIGFTAAGMIASGLLHLVFLFAFPFILDILPVSFLGILGKLVALMILARICVGVVISAFTLVIALPDMAINFMGVASKRVRVLWRV